MKIILSVFLFILSIQNSFSQEWNTIVPLDNCSEFTIDFKEESEDEYLIRYKRTPQSQYTYLDKPLSNINDLSSLTDLLISTAFNYCPFEFELEINTQAECHRIKTQARPFSDNYVSLLENFIGIINHNDNKCDAVIPYIELQEKITNLQGKDLIDFEESSSLAKIFADDEVDKIIDHFYACGGKKGTKKFIRNLIVLEAKKACLYPEPPGLLSLKETLSIANQLALETRPMGLISLNSEKDNITKKAVNKFADAILNKQLKSLLGEKFNTQAFIKNLDSIKAIKDAKEEKTIENLSYITSIDAPLEIVDKGIPYLVKENFEKVLPKTMTKEQKKNFLDKKITPTITENYNSCIAQSKERVKYNMGLKQKDLIKHRKNLETNFCAKYPHQCKSKTCGKTVKNYLTEREDISDMSVIQSCLFTSINKTMPDVLSVIIDGQEENFKDAFEFTPALKSQLSSKATKKLTNCLDTNVRAKSKNKVINKSEKEAYLHITASDYQELLSYCSSETEESLSEDFITLLLGNNDALVSLYDSPSTIQYYDKEINADVFAATQDIINSTLPSCLKEQKIKANKNSSLKPSASFCKPLIESEAASHVIRHHLEKTLQDQGIFDSPNKDELLSKFEMCKISAQIEIKSDLFNKKSRSPILTEQDANSYLDQNHTFYGCVTNAITDTTELVADYSLLNTIENSKDKLKEIKVFENEHQNIVKNVRSCFKEKLEKIGSWPNFVEYNANDGLSKLQQKCTNKASAYIVPKLITNEAAIQLSSLEEINLIGENSSPQITQSSIQELALELGVSFDKNKSSNYNLKKVFQKHQLNFPNLSQEKVIDSFIEKYSATVQSKTMEALDTNLIDKLIEDSKPGFDFSELKTALPAKCINNIYTNHKDKLADLIKLSQENATPSRTKTDVQEIAVDLLQKALIYSQMRGNYYSFLEDLKQICKSKDASKDVAIFKKLRLADDLFLSQLQNQIKASFEEVAIDQCYESLLQDEVKLPNELANKLCLDNNLHKSQYDDIHKQALNYLNDPKKKAILDIIINRKHKTISAVNDYFGRNSNIDKLFKDSNVLDYLYDNFDQVVAGVPKAKNELNKLALDKIFQDKGKSSFAYKFSKLQMISGIGISGYDIAKEKIDDKMENLGFIERQIKNRISENVNLEFNKRWKYAGISHYFNIDKMDSKTRTDLITSVYQNAILPRVDKDVTKSEQNEKMDKLSDDITDLINNYAMHENKDFIPSKKIKVQGSYVTIPAKGKGKLTFAEKLASDITDSTIDNIISGVKDSAKNKVDSLLDFVTP